ncbi:hypothetical protein IGI04_039685 [Brassica rapa subsp. trilocularis]|uniref:Acyl-[acyl-carrier-protein] hydrolase n=1 Tax=Brassica rapa subsp. trilocularis TaxID=1813537 RepID=A0ABQ7KP89_BRACM|nr:hypothetical protein IGI04_039685 [Brassica rapa subsp. trilocularis]
MPSLLYRDSSAPLRLSFSASLLFSDSLHSTSVFSLSSDSTLARSLLMSLHLHYRLCQLLKNRRVETNQWSDVVMTEEEGIQFLMFQSVAFSTDGIATTPTMRKLNLIWVTSRMHIEIYRYPAWGDVVEIETWCQSEGRIGTRRDWILKDIANAEVTGCATRLAFPVEESNRSLKKIPTLEDLAKYSIIGLKPRRADLDMNHHVNNFTYIGWILEVSVIIRRECQQDDVVDSLTTSKNGSATSGTQSHNDSQFLSGDGQEINCGTTLWRKKPSR